MRTTPPLRLEKDSPTLRRRRFQKTLGIESAAQESQRKADVDLLAKLSCEASTAFIDNLCTFVCGFGRFSSCNFGKLSFDLELRSALQTTLRFSTIM